MSADRVKWEHIHRVFELCNRNVSETARRLKMHRRTYKEFFQKDLQNNFKTSKPFYLVYSKVAIKF